MQFRQQALARLQSPEELDLPVRFARPQGWLVLSVTVIAMAAASVWALTGSVTSSVQAPAILTYGQGSYILQSPVAGQVTAVLVREGERLPPPTPRAEGPYTGRRPGRAHPSDRTDHRARRERRADHRDRCGRRRGGEGPRRRVPLYATVYVPAQKAAGIPAHASVDLTVQSVPSQEYGVLRGEVTRVDRSAQSPRQIAAFLGDAQLGEEFSRDGRPVAVTVKLKRSSRTESGYAWSSAEGPPFELTSMTLATGSIRLADRRPVDWLLP